VFDHVKRVGDIGHARPINELPLDTNSNNTNKRFIMRRNATTHST